MVKVIKPKKEFWETEKKPAYLKITKKKNEADVHIVRFEKEK